MYLIRQSVGVLLSPFESCERGMRLMSIYEIIMVILTIAGLVIEVISDRKNKK